METLFLQKRKDTRCALLFPTCDVMQIDVFFPGMCAEMGSLSADSRRQDTELIFKDMSAQTESLLMLWGAGVWVAVTLCSPPSLIVRYVRLFVDACLVDWKPVM